MTFKIKTSNWLMLLFAVVLFACKKQDITTPTELAHFTEKSSGNYTISGPNVTYKIPVGLTNVSSSPRTVNITVTSPTGAVEGTHYTLSTKSVVIPANQAVDSIEVKGVFSQYQAGRKDVLVFTIAETGVKPTSYNNTFTLNMRGPCFEGSVDLNDLLGEYKNTVEVFGTGAPYKYTTTVKSVQSTGPTSGKIVVSNIYDDGWNDLEFTLDWSNPNNRTVTLVAQNTGYDAGKLNSAYAGNLIEARPQAGGVTGTFSVCTQTIVLKFRPCFSLGCFSGITETMNR